MAPTFLKLQALTSKLPKPLSSELLDCLRTTYIDSVISDPFVASIRADKHFDLLKSLVQAWFEDCEHKQREGWQVPKALKREREREYDHVKSIFGTIHVLGTQSVGEFGLAHDLPSAGLEATSEQVEECDVKDARSENPRWKSLCAKYYEFKVRHQTHSGNLTTHPRDSRSEP